MKTLLLMVALAGTVGCMNDKCIKPKFDVPKRPSLPTINGDKLTCLDAETFALLLKREQGRRRYAEDLEAIVKECSK